MALDEAGLIWLRSRVGTKNPDDDTLGEIYDRQVATAADDPLAATALEVLQTRLADLRARPDRMDISGEYSDSVSEQMKQLETLIADVIEVGSDATVGTVRIVTPAVQRWR